MIKLNGNNFAENEEDLQNAMKEGHPCKGLAKRFKRQIKIMNLKNEQIAVINKFGVLGAATKSDDGKMWYSYATVAEIGKYESRTQRIEEIESLAISKISTGKFLEYVHQFK